MNDLTSYLCCGIFLVGPVLMFVMGYALGKHGLPWIIHVERKEKELYQEN